MRSTSRTAAVLAAYQHDSLSAFRYTQAPVPVQAGTLTAIMAVQRMKAPLALLLLLTACTLIAAPTVASDGASGGAGARSLLQVCCYPC